MMLKKKVKFLDLVVHVNRPNVESEAQTKIIDASSISALFSPSRPTAIGWFIITIVVDAID
jgi:hypothetical protein